MRDISSAISDKVFITGSLLIVEALPNEEVKTKSGLIVAKDDRQTNGVASSPPTFVRVLAVGRGIEGEEMATRVGDILLVGDYSVRYFSTFPGMDATAAPIGVCNEDQTQIRFAGKEAFEEFKAKLSG